MLSFFAKLWNLTFRPFVEVRFPMSIVGPIGDHRITSFVRLFHRLRWWSPSGRRKLGGNVCRKPLEQGFTLVASVVSVGVLFAQTSSETTQPFIVLLALSNPLGRGVVDVCRLVHERMETPLRMHHPVACT